MSNAPSSHVSISLNAAFQILKEAEAVLVDLGGNCVTFSGIGEALDGAPEAEFLNLHSESEGEEFDVAFREGDNFTVEIDGNDLLLVDTEGNQVNVTPLFSRNLV
jgi:hypothetical protein